MFDPYSILGIPRTSSNEEAKKAYRKMAMEHHPDRGGNEEKFKRIKGAWEMIDNGLFEASSTAHSSTPKQYPQYKSSFTKPEPAWRGAAEDPRSPWYSYNRPPPKPRQQQQRQQYSYTPPIVRAHEERSHLGDFVARVSMAEAYRGFILEVEIAGKKHQVTMPKGVPHNLRNTIALNDHEDITVTTRFHASQFQFKGIDTALREGVIVNSEPGIVYRTKDLRMDLEVSAEDFRRGKTLKVQDFLGETFDVKLHGSDFLVSKPQEIVIPGRGYVDWYSSHSQAGQERGDLYIRIIRTEIPEPTMLR